MLFYKFNCILHTEYFDCSSGQNQEQALNIGAKSEAACAKYHDSARLCYVKGHKGRCTIIGVFTSDSICNKSCEEILQEFLVETTSPGVLESRDEITESEFYKLLRLAERNNYLDDNEKILDSFNLEIGRLMNMRNCYSEALCRWIETRQEAVDLASQLCCGKTLVPEIRRIFAKKAPRAVRAHPVQYIVRTSKTDLTERIADLLIASLYANNRVISRRYAVLDMMNRIDVDEVDHLYNIGRGGTVVVMFVGDDDPGEYAGATMRKFEILARLVNKHSNDVLTIFCCSNEGSRTKDRFCEGLPGITFVEISEDAITLESAKAYLKRLALEKGVSSVRGLYNGLEAGSFTVRQLDTFFERWYDRHLRTSVFPQYASLNTYNAAAKKAKGNAYRELMDMIGLKEPKQLISKALDYFKAQKVFAHSKAFSDKPSMHMVFTGNPGTAKTTVARLFAQIMFDNGLLSGGHFVEVGRADLVAKYVGWTAQSVRDKFRAAKGGVLFIDEAYSLVDDRKGMFGDEAINTIVQEMENMRGDIVVIFAGYPSEMRDFLDRNPGLSSRIAFHIHFPDYTPEELMQIMLLLAGQKGRVLSEGAKDLLKADFASAVRYSGFGNGRYVRNMLEKAIMNQASRLLRAGCENIGEAHVMMLEACDFEIAPIESGQAARVIGFR